MKRLNAFVLIFALAASLLFGCDKTQTEQSGYVSITTAETGLESENTDVLGTDSTALPTSSATSSSFSQSTQTTQYVSEVFVAAPVSRIVGQLHIATVRADYLTQTGAKGETGEWNCSLSPSSGVEVTRNSYMTNGSRYVNFNFLTVTPGVYSVSLKRNAPKAEISFTMTVSEKPEPLPEPSSQTMKVGETYSVKMSRPTGGEWYCASLFDAAISVSSVAAGPPPPSSGSGDFLEISPGKFSERDELLVGDGGSRTFEFLAQKPGKHTVELKFGFPGSEPETKYSFTITVVE